MNENKQQYNPADVATAREDNELLHILGSVKVGSCIFRLL